MPARYLQRLSGSAIRAFEDVVREAAPLDQEKLASILGQVVRDRMTLAEDFLKDAPGRGFRLAVSRSYYAMYHAARSVVFAQKRMDVDEHLKLPANLPDDFPEREHWKDRLGFWRVKRDDADYSPYISVEDDPEALARDALRDAGAFLGACRQYLNERGAL